MRWRKSSGRKSPSADPEGFARARDYAFLLLKFRLRSEKELEERLRRKKFNPQLIAGVLAFLKEKKFIDDTSFARAWIQSRLKKPLGLRRIKQELKLKGIDSQVISEQLGGLTEGYSEEQITREIAKEKFRRLGAGDPQKTKRRIYAYLLRRGFSGEAAGDALSQL